MKVVATTEFRIWYIKMPKKKISKQPKKYFESMPNLKMRDKKSDITRFNSVKRVKDKKYISKALWECIISNDTTGFKEIMRAHLKLVQKEEFIKKTGLSQKALSRIVSKKGNPTLDNISKVIYHLHTSL